MIVCALFNYFCSFLYVFQSAIGSRVLLRWGNYIIYIYYYENVGAYRKNVVFMTNIYCDLFDKQKRISASLSSVVMPYPVFHC